MSPMRIAHVTATYPPYKGGTGNVCYHNARELVMRGHEVHVFTAAFPDAARYELQDGINVHRLRPVLRIGNAPLLPQLVTALRDFDIIHLHYPFIIGAELVRLASLLYRIPLIITFHNDLIGDGTRAKLFAAYQEFSAKVTVRHASTLCVVTMDHYLHSQLRESLAENRLPVVEVPNGVDTDLFHPATSPGLRDLADTAKVMLFVGTLDRAHHYRRVDLLLEALAQTNDPDLRLVIVGDGDKRADYEALSSQLGLGSSVHFLGALEPHELPAIYTAVDVVVLPASLQESFGMTLIESMACGTPVITSALPGVRSVVTDGRDGMFVMPGSASELANTIRHFFSLPASVRREMGEVGRKKAKRQYTWCSIGDRLDELYHQVAGRQRPQRQRRTTTVEATS